eukprot:Hpha_TRINITY_DN16450_c1_g3::TRINITY_DN16450_c1_g3_i1::g.163831::m.163831
MSVMPMGSFSVLVGVDFGSGKINFEIVFPGRPSIPQLRDRIQHDLSAEAAVRRAEMPFEIYRAQIFDERLQMWVDLMSAGQLEHLCQVYVFQREQAGSQRDRPGRIPPPVRPSATAGPVYSAETASLRGGALMDDFDRQSVFSGSPLRVGDSTAHGFGNASNPQALAEGRFPENATPQEKARIAFSQLHADRRATGHGVSRSDWSTALRRLHLLQEEPGKGLSAATCDSLFEKADRNKDGVLSVAEFSSFAARYTKLLDSIYYRSKEMHLAELKAKDIEQQRTLEESSQNVLIQAKEAVEEAEGAVKSAGATVEQRARDIDAALQAEREAQRSRDTAVQCKDDAAAAVQRARSEQTTQKEAERRSEQEYKGLQRIAEAARKKTEGKRAELEVQQRLVQQLERQLQEAMAERTRREESLAAAEDEARAATAAAEGDDGHIQAAVRAADDTLAAAEAQLRQALGDERTSIAAVQAAARAVQEARKDKSVAEREEASVRQRYQQREQALTRAESAQEEQKRRREQLEQAEEERNAKWEEQMRNENELVAMEEKVQADRDAVEQKAEALQLKHRTFCETAGRSSPARAHPPEAASVIRETHTRPMTPPRY